MNVQCHHFEICATVTILFLREFFTMCTSNTKLGSEQYLLTLLWPKLRKWHITSATQITVARNSGCHAGPLQPCRSGSKGPAWHPKSKLVEDWMSLRMLWTHATRMRHCEHMRRTDATKAPCGLPEQSTSTLSRASSDGHGHHWQHDTAWMCSILTKLTHKLIEVHEVPGSPWYQTLDDMLNMSTAKVKHGIQNLNAYWVWYLRSEETHKISSDTWTRMLRNTVNIRNEPLQRKICHCHKNISHDCLMASQFLKQEFKTLEIINQIAERMDKSTRPIKTWESVEPTTQQKHIHMTAASSQPIGWK